MSKTQYRSYHDLTEPQEKVMKFIIWWVNTEKTPVPRKEVMKKMKAGGMSEDTVKLSLHVLLAKGYVREGYTSKYNTVVYVQLRSI